MDDNVENRVKKAQKNSKDNGNNLRSTLTEKQTNVKSTKHGRKESDNDNVIKRE